MKEFRVLIAIIIGCATFLSATDPAHAAPTEACDALFEQKRWMGAAFLPQEQALAVWPQMRACLAAEESYQARTDAYAMATMHFLNDKDPGQAGLNFLAHVMRALTVNAELGFASSQHNLAGMYNAPPGSYQFRRIEQDDAKFAYWTKQAAAQREPRALMTMAFRLAADEPVPGFQQDAELAYLLVLEWERIAEATQDPKLSGMATVMARFKEDLARDLSADGKARIAARATEFDFKTLAD